ncbi:hypothetical protein FYK55_07755 [Roseiconus nitratireducens]|uniref:Las17-binding protein actin regulator n=1 Tax=Roseiconus nitratireducens TaxID=2605748 RepID=A0A5M6DDD2_9BACT|nr:hypothetical protein [Roseiconus nitratireducens]KAA5545528.1 hypothetical protein FYK55_07755 [Roseiconus nitratireducens]
MRPFKQLLALIFITATFSPAVFADKTTIIGGEITFAHVAIDPTAPPDGFCDDPPGALYSVESDALFGSLETRQETLAFSGAGQATGCAYLVPLDDGTAARFTGSFVWHTEDGDLNGTFELIDGVIDGVTGVFSAVVFIEFTGGTERFQKARGSAVAIGYDFPFGGLGGNVDVGGLAAQIIAGEMKLKE